MEGFMEVKENWERRYKEEKRKVPGEILFRSFCQILNPFFHLLLLHFPLQLYQKLLQENK